MKRKSETLILLKDVFVKLDTALMLSVYISTLSLNYHFFAPPVTKDTLSFHTSPDLLFARTSHAELITWANLKHPVSSKDNFLIIIT